MIEKKLVDIEMNVGKPAKFDATVTGLPQPDVNWQKDGLTLESNERVSIEAKGTTKVLSIKKTQPEDIGSYTITATNEAGQDSSSANLSVRGNGILLMKI